MTIRSVRLLLRRRFSRRRMRDFIENLRPARDTSILDVGGTPYLWRFVDRDFAVTLLNRTPPPAGAAEPGLTFVEGDGTALGYPDRSFDIVFSNSVIEHLATWENQRRFAHELRRVGRRLWVQTPARSFFFEPHFVAPFIHWLPERWQRRLARRFTLWGLMARPTREEIERQLREIRLLDAREMRELFPDCEIRRERFCGMTKAYVAVRS